MLALSLMLRSHTLHFMARIRLMLDFGIYCKGHVSHAGCGYVAVAVASGRAVGDCGGVQEAVSEEQGEQQLPHACV